MRSSIPETIIDRAIELWCRELFAPRFDNGDNSPAGVFGMSLSQINSANDKSKVEDFAGKVNLFKSSLKEELVALRDDDEKHMPCFLSTDYGPDRLLSDVAEKCGIPPSQFSIKSNVCMGQECVYASFGYGAEPVYHYPLPKGGWLITKLSGEDINIIIDSIEQGNPLNFQVEE